MSLTPGDRDEITMVRPGAAAVAFIVLSSAYAAIGSIPSGAVPEGPPNPPPTAIERATDQAAETGSPVQVESLDSMYSTTYANPNGSLTRDTSQAPIRIKQGTDWVDVDYELERVNGGWSPKASPVDVVFSDGGDHDAVSLGDGSKQLDLDWAVALPAPTIIKDSARYDLGDGQTLVLTANSGGFEQSLVLAHAPSSLPQVRLPIDTNELNMSTDAAGGYIFSNSDGTPVWTMPAPVMYGPIDPKTEEPSEEQPVSASVVHTSTGPRLNLAPSLKWLQNPARTFPIVIDPTVSAFTNSGDSYVVEGSSTNQGTSWRLHAGSWDGHASRAYLRFSGLSSLSGESVTSATLKVYNYDINKYTSSSCLPATIKALPLTESVTLSSVTWATRPAYGTSPASQLTFAHGIDGICANSSETFDVTPLVKAWTSGTLTNNGLQLSGAESTTSQGWAFCSMNTAPAGTGTSCENSTYGPRLSVTFDDPGPEAPLISSVDYPPNFTAPDLAGASEFDLTMPLLPDDAAAMTGASAATQYVYRFDTAAWTTISAADTTTLSYNPSVGTHTLSAYAIDKWGVASEIVTYGWTVGTFDSSVVGPDDISPVQEAAEKIESKIEQSGWSDAGFVSMDATATTINVSGKGPKSSFLTTFLQQNGYDGFTSYLSTPYSRAEMDAEQQRIFDANPGRYVEVSTTTGLSSIVITPNASTFGLPQGGTMTPSQRSSETTSVHSTIPIEFEPASSPSQSAVASTSGNRSKASPPFWGGSLISKRKSDGTLNICSTGMGIKYSDGTVGVTTARHCGPGLWRSWGSGRTVGYVEKYSTKNDTEALTPGTGRAAAGVWTGPWNSSNIAVVYRVERPIALAKVCAQGGVSGQWCKGTHVLGTYRVNVYEAIDVLGNLERVGPGFWMITEETRSNNQSVSLARAGDSGAPCATFHSNNRLMTIYGFIVAVNSPVVPTTDKRGNPSIPMSYDGFGKPISSAKVFCVNATDALKALGVDPLLFYI